MKTTEEKVRLTWRHDRTHELRLGHTVIVFAPHGTQVVPRWVIDHAEFINQRMDFVIQPE